MQVFFIGSQISFEEQSVSKAHTVGVNGTMQTLFRKWHTFPELQSSSVLQEVILVQVLVPLSQTSSAPQSLSVPQGFGLTGVTQIFVSELHILPALQSLSL